MKQILYSLGVVLSISGLGLLSHLLISVDSSEVMRESETYKTIVIRHVKDHSMEEDSLDKDLLQEEELEEIHLLPTDLITDGKRDSGQWGPFSFDPVHQGIQVVYKRLSWATGRYGQVFNQ